MLSEKVRIFDKKVTEIRVSKIRVSEIRVKSHWKLDVSCVAASNKRCFLPEGSGRVHTAL